MPARRGLLSSQTGKPDVEPFQCLHQRLDLTQLAAAPRVASVQYSKFRFLFRNALSRFNVHQVQVPRSRHTVTKQSSRLEVIARIKKEDRNVGKPLTKEMQHNHILGLEAVRKTSATVVL